MTDKQALAKARKLLGKHAAIGKSPGALTGDEWVAARAQLTALRAAKPDRADREAYRAWLREEDRLMGLVFARRCQVMRVSPLASGWWPVREIVGVGDDWEEALAEAAAKR